MQLPSRIGRILGPCRGDRVAPAAARALLAIAVLALPAAAQEPDATSPLTKSQLIRLVTSSTYTQPEIVQIVEASCLSFEPTERDFQDLSSLGASGPVLDAVRGCGRTPAASGQPGGAEAGGAAPAAVAPAAVAPVGRLALADRSVAGSVGTTVTVAARLESGGAPIANRRLILRGSGAVIGGGGTDLSASTDAAGRVAFAVQTGTAARVYPLTIIAGSGTLEGNPNLELTVRPGRAARADFSPARLALQSDGAPSRIEATVRDRYGNAIPGAVVALVLPAAAGGSTLPGTTDSRGVASFAVVTSGLSEGDRLDLLSGGTQIANVAVGPPSRPLAEEKQAEQPAPVVAAGDADGEAPGDMAAGLAVGAGGAAVDSMLALGREAEERRDYARAELYYRQALDEDPGNTAAQQAMGALSLARGQPDNAMLWYQAAVGRAPGDAELWLGLGRARAEAGYADEAEEAFRRVLELDPENREAQQLLAGRAPGAPLLEASVWGGNTFDNTRSAGLRSAELIVWALPSLSIWGRYDNSLALYEWALVRGPDDVEGIYGGAGLDWGPRGVLSTRFEIGRREPPGRSGVYQNFYHLEQGIRVSSGLNAVRVAAGGYLGRWFDRDDWQIYAKAEVPAGAELTLVPAVYVGETVGTAFAEIGRVAANELRGYLTIDFRPIRALRLQPSFGLGSVSSDDARLDGTLLDALLRLTAGSGVVRGEAFLRYQDAPGIESFTVLAVGLTLGLPRGGL